MSPDWRVARQASRDLVEVGIFYLQRHRAPGLAEMPLQEVERLRSTQLTKRLKCALFRSSTLGLRRSLRGQRSLPGSLAFLFLSRGFAPRRAFNSRRCGSMWSQIVAGVTMPRSRQHLQSGRSSSWCRRIRAQRRELYQASHSVGWPRLLPFIWRA
jgi:hypothetical protein